MSLTEIKPELAAALEESGADALLKILEGGSAQTVRHSVRVGNLAMKLGEVIPDVSEPAAFGLGFSGILHDVGKSHPRIADLIDLPRKFAGSEARIVRNIHTNIGSQMIAQLKVPGKDEGLIKLASFVALNHHNDMIELSRRNGTNPATIMTANLVHVVDVFDAIQDQGRPYNELVVSSPEQAAAFIAEGLEFPSIFGVDPDEIPNLLLGASN